MGNISYGPMTMTVCPRPLTFATDDVERPCLGDDIEPSLDLDRGREGGSELQLGPRIVGRFDIGSSAPRGLAERDARVHAIAADRSPNARAL